MHRWNLNSRQRASLGTALLLFCLGCVSHSFPTQQKLNRIAQPSFDHIPHRDYDHQRAVTTTGLRYLSNDIQRDSVGEGRRLTVLSSSLGTSMGERSTKFSLFQIVKERKSVLATIILGLSLPLSGRPLSKATFILFAKIFGCFSLASASVSNVKSRQRQSLDATSEWQRYAQNPGARGRAIMLMMTKQLLFITAARITGLVGKKSKAASIRQHAGRKFSNGLLKLGPLYIKLGQIVSCRPGLLGKEWVDALSDLQDKVPARTGEKAMDLVYSALEGGKDNFDRIFKDFDSTPLAAASLGQVHRATLRENGNEVALKVQRPHLRQIYDQDFKLLTTIAKMMDKISKSGRNVGGVESSWTRIFADAESILYREIDYRDEAENAVRFAKDFGLGLGGVSNSTSTALARNNKALPDASEWIRTPYIYTGLSNEQLLVQEYVPSFKVTDKEKLDAANISQEDRIKLADDLARAYLRQFCSNFFFSTDPHPGKLPEVSCSYGRKFFLAFLVPHIEAFFSKFRKHWSGIGAYNVGSKYREPSNEYEAKIGNVRLWPSFFIDTNSSRWNFGDH